MDVKVNFPTLALIIVLVAAMFFGGRYLANRSAGNASLPPGRAGGNVKGQPAPEFELKDLQGKSIRLSDYQGKVVLLNFWATWCPPCKEEMPWFVDLQQRYGAQGLQVIGIAMDDADQKTVGSFAQRLGVNYPVLLGKESVADAYGNVQFLPDTFYIGRDGKILRHVQGLIDRKSIEEEVKQALSAPARSAHTTGPATDSAVVSRAANTGVPGKAGFGLLGPETRPRTADTQ
jgi:cytochrome c biogenesis protein CcmG/thiol:disulfide interchange protein DsbE